jgi:hypothetical protein
MSILKRSLISLMVFTVIAVFSTAVVFADTNGSEIQITDQPDKLILQLGPQWAGVEFELKTDAGVFPVPVVVDATGILKMDLGGSKTYILSCLASDVTAPGPDNPAETQTTAPPSATTADSGEESAAEQSKGGVPTGILIMFLLGLAAAVGGLLAMRYVKRRRESYDYDDEDNDYDE